MLESIIQSNIKIYYRCLTPSSKLGYYSISAKSKRKHTLEYLSKRYGNTCFNYLDAFCSTGVMGILLNKNLPCVNLILNDKYVDSRLIALNSLINGIDNFEIYSKDAIDLKVSSQVIQLDPYGSCIPYILWATKYASERVIATHTDLINLCSRRSCSTFFNKHGVNIGYTEIKYELAIRSLLYVYYKITNTMYYLEQYYKGGKYLTLYLSKVHSKKIDYVYKRICFCGATNLEQCCKFCKRKCVRMGPLYYLKDDPVLGEIGGINKRLLFNDVRDELMLSAGFYKGVDCGIFKRGVNTDKTKT